MLNPQKCALIIKSLSKPGEEWKPVEGFNSKYFVSTEGRVFSGTHKRILKPWLNRYKYFQVYLSKNNERNFYRLCRLVLSTFQPNNDRTLQTHHINHNSKDDRLANLMWVSARQNILYSVEYRKSLKNSIQKAA